MCEKKSLAGVSHKDWLRLRKTGIGGSDAGAICGLNPYSSPVRVFVEKTSDQIEKLDSEAMRQGRDLEEYVARRFMEATGKKVRRSNFMYRSKEHQYMIADVDRLIVGEDAGLECKTASTFNADQWKDGAVPRHYLLQCYHYMAVTGKRNWYIAVVVLGQGFQYAKLEWDEKVISDLIAVEGDFWFNHVVPNVMPAADGSKATDQVLDQLYGSKTMPAAMRLDGFEKRLTRRNEIGEQIKLLEQEQKQIDQEVKMYMGSHETAICEGFKVSWQSVTSSRLDTKRIKVEQPELYQEYLTESTSRKFTVKAA